MKILHILDHSLPLHSGYVFRTLSILAHQRQRGWETVQLTTPRHKRPSPPTETVDGWSFYRTPPIPEAADRIPGLREFAEMRATRRRLDEVIALEAPDVLHAHSPVLNAVPAWRAARRHGLPFVYEVRAFWEDAAVDHGSTSEGSLRYRLTRALETLMLRRADAVTTICEGLRSDIVARGIDPARVTVIPNAVNVGEFQAGGVADEALKASLGLAGKRVLGFIGSFYAYEGLDLLLEAMARLRASRADVAVLLVGGGPQEARLREQAERLQLGASVRFVGRVPHAEVQRYYDLVDVLVYPRHAMRLTELVTPLKPLEAMAQQRVVMASDVGGHRELIRDGETGYLFPADDAEALARAIDSVLAAAEKWPALKARARRFVETERNWERSVAGYVPIYAELAARRAAA